MKLVKPIQLAALASTAALFAFTTHAGEMKSEEKPEKTAFVEIDTNQDGSISASEAGEKNRWLAANFVAIDTNRDGLISKAEFEKALS